MKKPNIILIFSDQQHKYALGKNDPHFITPNLDALCEEGVLFENAYSSNPICGPYRGCLLTGLMSCHSGVMYNGYPLPKDEPSLADHMNCAGYDTYFVGKWHLGANGDSPIPPSIQGGFCHYMGYQCHNGFEPAPPYNNKVSFYDSNGEEHVYNKHRTEVTTDIALNMIKMASLKSDTPFFLLVGYQAPHYPVQPSLEFEELYKDTVFDKSPDYESVDPYTPTYNPPSPSDKTKDPDFLRYGGDMDGYMKLYAAMVSQIDRGVGRIINTLKSLKIYQNTIVIFTSDHGDMQGSHGLKNKCLPYEKSCGVPLICKVPNGQKNRRLSAPVSTVDIFATVLAAGGVTSHVPCDGTSFLEYAIGSSAFARDYVVSEHRSRNRSVSSWRMIRDARYKLVTDYQSFEPQMLFDMQNDPWEMNNLVNESKMAAEILRLKSILVSEIEKNAKG